MPKQINLPNFAQGLVQRFALKGRYQPVLDETIVPVAIVTSFEGGGLGGVPAASVEKSAIGTIDMDGSTGGAARSWVSLVNPVDSGVGLNIDSVSIGFTFAIADAFPTTPAFAQEFYIQRMWIADIFTPTQTGIYATIIKNTQFMDDRLKNFTPVAQIDGGTVASAAGWSLAEADFVTQQVFPDAFREVGTPGTNAAGGEQQISQQVNTILLKPGRGLYVRALGGVALDTLGRYWATFRWTEIPLTAGTTELAV